MIRDVVLSLATVAVVLAAFVGVWRRAPDSWWSAANREKALTDMRELPFWLKVAVGVTVVIALIGGSLLANEVQEGRDAYFNRK